MAASPPSESLFYVKRKHILRGSSGSGCFKTFLSSSSAQGIFTVIFFFVLIFASSTYVILSNVTHKGAAQTKLAIVIPFVTHNTSITIRTLNKWAETGRPCSQIGSDSVGLHFLQNKDDLLFDVGDFLEEVQATKFLKSYKSCFSRVQVDNAKLSVEEDAYPAGPSYMFFSMFKAAHLRHFAALYDAFFWAEWDVSPVKASWIDALVREASFADFWVRGSVLKGSELDGAVGWHENAEWAPHINGNALYKLRDLNFMKYLDVVMEYEPPGHFWKPFDVAMWKVLHSFPYSWRLYQRFRPKFQHRDFIAHFSFGVTKEHVEFAKASKDVFLVHGNPGSSGKVMFEKKFSNASAVSHTDFGPLPISESHNISVMLRTFAADAVMAETTIASIYRYAPGIIEIVVVVPSRDREVFASWTTRPKVIVFYETEILSNGQLQQKLSKLHADKYCTGKYILHLDSDVVFFRKLLYRDLFWRRKPVIEFDLYSNLPQRARFWQYGTSDLIGKRVDVAIPRVYGHLFPRETYGLARAHLKARFKASVRTVIQNRIPSIYDFQLENRTKADLKYAFSEYNFLGAYLWYFQRDLVSWSPLDSFMVVSEDFPSPIIPVFTCQGNAQLARYVGQQQEHAQTLHASVEEGHCGHVEEHVRAMGLLRREKLRGGG